jgi:hypothetical protein
MVEPFIWKGFPLAFPPGSVLAGDLSYNHSGGVGKHIFFPSTKINKVSVDVRCWR